MLRATFRKLREFRRDAFIRKRTKAILRSGFWFTDIPRTGSTTLKVQLESLAFAGYGKSGDFADHASSKPFFKDHTPAKHVCQSIGKDNWNNLFTFTIVRNPWSRFFSLYNYRLKMGLISPKASFEEYARLLKKANVWSEHSPYRHTEFWWPMTGFLVDETGEILVKKVYRFEDYNFAIDDLGTKLGIELKSSTSLNNSELGCSYCDAYTPETREIIEEFYACDIERFGYTFST